MSKQCEGITPANNRCTKTIVKGKYCVMHDTKHKKQRSHNARIAGNSPHVATNRKRGRDIKDPFQDLITIMVRKALIEIIMEKP